MSVATVFVFPLAMSEVSSQGQSTGQSTGRSTELAGAPVLDVAVV